MAYDHATIIQSQYSQLENERASAFADLEAGRLNEDAQTTMTAANRILEVDQKRAALDRIAQQFNASQQAPRGNQWGLSADEIEIADTHPDDRMSVEQKRNLFAHSKQRYQQDKASGLRRDDQGTVRR